MNSTIIRIAAAGSLAALMVSLTPLVGQASPFWLMGSQLPPGVEQLDLTSQQRNQIQGIRSDAVGQLRRIIEADQLQQFGLSMAQGQSFNEAVQSMNITAAQRSEIQSVFDTMRQDINGVLTPQQQQTWAQYRESQGSESLNPLAQ